MSNIQKYAETFNFETKTFNPEYALDSIGDVSTIKYDILIQSLKNAADYFKSNECTILTEDKTLFLANYLGNTYGYWFLDLYDNISMHLNQTNIKTNINDVCEMISELFVNIQDIEEVDEAEFFKKIELSNHPMIRILRANDHSNKLFFKNILAYIKTSHSAQHPLLSKMRELRQSAKGRRLIMSPRKKTTADTKIESLFKLFESYGVATRAEIYMKLEKFIESGWYDHLNPLADFLSGLNSEHYAFSKLQHAMGSCFFKGTIQSKQYNRYNEYSLVLNDDSKLKSEIFNLATGGQFDSCIFSPDGKKLFITEVTTDESGETNKNKWLSILKAIRNFKITNPDIEVHFNISLMSLFYDGNEKSNIKQFVINKFEDFNIRDRIDWQLLQVLSCLDRESDDFSDLYDLLSNMTLNITGSKLEDEYNKVFSDKQNFIDTVFSTFDRVFNKLISTDGFFEKTVEFDLIKHLYQSFAGFEKLIYSDDSNLERYTQYNDKILQLLDKINVSDGGLGNQLERLSRGLTPSIIKDANFKKKEKCELARKEYETQKELAAILEIKNKKINITKLEILSKVILDFATSVKSLIGNQNNIGSDVVVDPLIKTARYFKDISVSLTQGSLKPKPIDYLSYYQHSSNKTLINKIDCFTSSLRSIWWSVDCVDTMISKTEKLLDTTGLDLIDFMKTTNFSSLFRTNNVINTQRQFTNFGEYTLKYLDTLDEYKNKTTEYKRTALLYMNPRKASAIGESLFKQEIDHCVNILEKGLDTLKPTLDSNELIM